MSSVVRMSERCCEEGVSGVVGRSERCCGEE